MKFFADDYKKIEERYDGPEGDRFALEELAPVVRRFLPPGGRVLEVGCGRGRNLVALSSTDAALLVGTDIYLSELKRARTRLEDRVPEAQGRVGLVRQDPFALPFHDGAFDVVVLWQVIEHVFGNEAKRRFLAECVRVLRSGGHLLVETPNLWFPIDYHDNKLPLVHWILPNGPREWLTWKVRNVRYHPSHYVSIPSCARMLRSITGVTKVTKATRIYFSQDAGEAWERIGGTRAGAKRLLFAALLPVHAVLSPFGGSADLFLPSLRVVWRIEKGTRG